MSNLAAAAYVVSDTTDTRIIEVPVRGLTIEEAVTACDRAIASCIAAQAPVHIEVQAAADMCDDCVSFRECGDAMGCDDPDEPLDLYGPDDYSDLWEEV